MRRIIIIAFLFQIIILPGQAYGFLFIEPGVGFLTGDHDSEETEGTTQFEHDGWLYGVEAGGRAGLNILGIQIGGTAWHQRTHMDGKRSEKVQESNGSTYNNTLAITLTGLYGGFKLPKANIRLLGEYYTEAKMRVRYAKPGAANLFSNKDRMKGDGYGLGVGYLEKKRNLAVSFLYRSLDFDEFTHDGVKSNLPDGQYTPTHIDQVVFQLSVFLEIL